MPNKMYTSLFFSISIIYFTYSFNSSKKMCVTCLQIKFIVKIPFGNFCLFLFFSNHWKVVTKVYDPRIDGPTKRVNLRSLTKLLFCILQNSRKKEKLSSIFISVSLTVVIYVIGRCRRWDILSSIVLPVLVIRQKISIELFQIRSLIYLFFVFFFLFYKCSSNTYMLCSSARLLRKISTHPDIPVKWISTISYYPWPDEWSVKSLLWYSLMRSK